jgi:hypothetical protein
MDAERYIAALKGEQTAMAVEALLKPKQRDTFEYGHVSGYAQGLERALTILQEQQDEADGKARPKAAPAGPRNPYLQELDNAPILPEQMGRRR